MIILPTNLFINQSGLNSRNISLYNAVQFYNTTKSILRKGHEVKVNMQQQKLNIFTQVKVEFTAGLLNETAVYLINW